ncbi:MAG: D-alanine--D-alanine ligase [Flavisolibacter sp.]
MWFFSASNPTLTFGGFEGESKKEMYDQLPTGSYPRSLYISHNLSFEAAKNMVISSHFPYPFVVKPDVGMMGLMFRKINNELQFEHYHTIMPAPYIVQEFINYPMEVSVFYYRFPNREKGTITGFLKKEFLELTGDGHHTIWELIRQYPRVQFRLEEMKAKHIERLQDILRPGEKYNLSPALNLSRGGRLLSLENEKDDQLLTLFNRLSSYTKYFYYGRYDIKCNSVKDLKEGKNFSILEFNGSGAEPHHIYGNGFSLLQAYKIVIEHWKVLYRISKINHTMGTPYWSYKKGLQFLSRAKKHFALLKKLDGQTAL